MHYFWTVKNWKLCIRILIKIYFSRFIHKYYLSHQIKHFTMYTRRIKISSFLFLLLIFSEWRCAFKDAVSSLRVAYQSRSARAARSGDQRESGRIRRWKRMSNGRQPRRLQAHCKSISGPASVANYSGCTRMDPACAGKGSWSRARSCSRLCTRYLMRSARERG